MLAYFAYGSNTNIAMLRDYLRGLNVDTDFLREPERAILHGYRLRTNYLTSIGTGAANIEPADGSHVEGALLGISQSIHEAIRRKEGYPCRYVEQWVCVELPTDGRTVPAFTYVVSTQCRLRTDALVSRAYRQSILQAARHIGFSPRYQSGLRSILRTA